MHQSPNFESNFFDPLLFATESTLAIGLINVLTPDVKRLLPSCLTSRSVQAHAASFSNNSWFVASIDRNHKCSNEGFSVFLP